MVFAQTIQDLADMIQCSLSWQRMVYLCTKGTLEMHFFAKKPEDSSGTGKLIKADEDKPFPGKKNNSH